MNAAAWPASTGDMCADVFGAAIRAYAPALPPDAVVLEIGCAEFDWLTQAHRAWPGWRLTGIDWRGGPRDCASVIQGDVLRHDFDHASFDAIVAISTMEHLGLGHYDQDPVCEDGDRLGMARAYTWLKPGGWMYLDVPWNAGSDAYRVEGTSHRVYDDIRVQERLIGSAPWVERWRGWVALHAPQDMLPIAPTTHLHGGGFYFIGLWLQKPETEH